MKLKFINIFFLYCLLTSAVFANENFYFEAKNLFENKKYEESKFLFQRNIVYNPKDAKSYLYLAKIFNNEENEKEELKNLNTALLLEPNNEDAMYMLIDMELKRSNFSKVEELMINFTKICTNLCVKKASIKERLKNFESENKS
tara:strand:+ start:26 stop:457 length:432 start_codon:yes stop_codon:yes gene_type:complete